MKKQGTCLAALLGALCLFPQGALAEETVSATMKPVVVTATKTEHSLGETTADVSVVTREQIEKMPANNVLDVMRTMPGVTVDSARSFYGTSTQNKVIIRGMGGDDVNGRVLVLMDGLPVMTAGNNIFNWDTISLDTVERIEVVRGPASALYGSSAMGGVINIITRKPTEEGFKTTVGTKFGRYNTWQNKLYYTGAIDKFSYAISGSMLKSHGFNVLPEHSPKTSSNRNEFNSAREKMENYNGALALNYRFDETADLSIHGEMSSFENTGRWHIEEFNLYSNKHQGIGARLHKDFGVVDSSFSVRGDFTKSDYDNASKTVKTSEAPSRMRTVSWDQSNTFALGDMHLFTVGVAGSWGKFDSESNYFTSTRYTQKGGKELNLSGYLQDEISIWDGKLTVVPGVRYDYWRSKGYLQDTNDRVNPDKQDFASTSNVRFSPKLGVRVDPWDNLVVFRSNYGEAFRAPTLNDLFGGSIIGSSRYKSNPDLKPELSKTWDVGVDVNPTDRLTLNVTGYKTWAEDYIANIPKGKEDGYNIKIKENIDKVTITGIEANIHYQYNEYLKLFAEGTALRPEIRSGANQGNHLHNVPTRKASLGFTFSHPDWFTLQASATWLGRIWQDQTDNGDIAEGNFWLGEFKLSKRFDYERYWLEPFIEMQGITTKDEIRYTNGSRVPINMFFVGLEAGF